MLVLAGLGWGRGVATLDSTSVMIDPAASSLLKLRGNAASDPATWSGLPGRQFDTLQDHSIWIGWKAGMVLLRLPLQAKRQGTWWIKIDNAGIDSVRVECAGRASGWIGDAVPRSKWCAPWHGFYLPVHLQPGTNLMHIQVKNSGRLGLVLLLRPEPNQQMLVENHALRDGILVGILLANLLLALWLFLAARAAAHFWYVAYQAMVVVFLFGIQHHFSAWIWPRTPWADSLWPRMLQLTVSSISIFGVLGLFMNRLLELDVHFPKSGRLLKWLSVALLACAGLQLLLPWTTAVFDILYQDYRIEVLEISSYLLAAGLTIALARKGHRTALLVLIAMSPMAVALGVTLAGEIGHFPWAYEYRGLVAECGLTLENLGFSLLLVRRFIRERQGHRDLLERYLSLELDFSRRLAQETDRNLRGAALELHGGLGQELTDIEGFLGEVFERVGRGDLLQPVASELRRIHESVRASANRIYPAELMELGIRHALERLAGRLSATGEIEVAVAGDMRGLSEEASLHWYRIAQEAIANAQRHGKATRIEVYLAIGRMTVRDDGIGVGAGAPAEGLGMRGIRQRASLLGCTSRLLPNRGGGCVLEIGNTRMPMDLKAAIDKHLEWKSTFLEAIATRQEVDAVCVADDHCCELGRWLDARSRSWHGKVASLAVCMAEHSRFHREAGKVAREINSRNYREAEILLGAFSEYSTASSAVASAILELHRDAGL